ncbi:MAG: hypothetical protein JEZ06_14670 [Anaerolineaceae bacterium]|nr:hypothetical protein [Anaerolineaceae bacterium]
MINELEIWLNNVGYTGELSALVAGLLDIRESTNKIYEELIPALLELHSSKEDEVLDILVDLFLEFEHIVLVHLKSKKRQPCYSTKNGG